MGAVVRRADPGLLRQVTTTPRPVTMPGAPTTTPTTPTTMFEFRVSVTGQKNLRIAINANQNRPIIVTDDQDSDRVDPDAHWG